MRHVGLFHAQSRGTDEALVFGRLAGEVLPHEGAFGHDSLPGLGLLAARAHHLEHLVVGHGLDPRDRHFPLAGLVLALLLHRVAQHLRAAHALAVQQVRRHGPLRHLVVVRMLVVPLVVLADRLPHRRLLLEPPLVVQLGPQAVHLLRKLRPLVHQPRLPLTLPLRRVEPTPVQLAVPFHVLVLRHGCCPMFVRSFVRARVSWCLFGCQRAGGRGMRESGRMRGGAVRVLRWESGALDRGRRQ
mmetsp:Transcript_19661/g.39857  ORF Transcript_19661/g.39857 Transcript_19661/m.39857 type:complete len:243 (-) Transcript_19661:53-781(-)